MRSIAQSSPPDPRFVCEDFEPVYLETSRRGLLPGKVAAGLAELEDCRICPRGCGVNRLREQRRVCHTGRRAIVSSAFAHLGEEDCLRGWAGSGTIFFSLCNVDIYMPDFKFWKRETAKRLAKAPDYPERAREAICEMHRQVGPLRFAANGLARRGVLVRHLVMPGQADESTEIFRWLAEELSPDTYVNIMGQYRPEYEVGQSASQGEKRFSEINSRPTNEELAGVKRSAREAGLWRFDERSRC